MPRAWRITSWCCAGVIIASVLACVGMAAARSNGLIAVTLTALDPSKEPIDHKLPLVKRHEALPDYELSLIDRDGRATYLGVKPNESAAAGLTWRLVNPVSTWQIAAVRLREQDAIISDDLAEVQLTGTSVEANGYRFDFEAERSVGIGVEAFFGTPIGKAIAAAFAIAIVILVLARFL